MNPLTIKLLSFKNITFFYRRRHPLKFFLIILCIILTIIGIYFALVEGFNFLIHLGGIGSVILKRLLFIMFSILFFMIAISFGILFYTSGVKSKETEFHLLLPQSLPRITYFKFWEAVFLSSWIPLVGLIIFSFAYTKINHLSFTYPFIAIFHFIPFIIIASFLGYITSLGVLRFLNIKKFFIFSLILTLLLILLYKKELTQEKTVLYFLSEKVAFLKFSQLWYLPYSWVTKGLVALEENYWGKVLIYLSNLYSLSALCVIFVPLLGDKFFLPCFYKHFYASHKKTYPTSLWDNILKIKFLPVSLRNFLLKDIKLFLREPALWLQFLVFFGLLFFYFLNLRKFSYHAMEPIWKNLISFLNTFSVLCIVCSLSIRFVFPQWSLEGRNFWILKLAPFSLKEIFLEKFIFSFLPLAIISGGLILVSNIMLESQPSTFYFTLFITLITCFVTISFSLGLGAYFADFKRDYYLKAVESIGGVIALILNLTYIIITIFTFASINHLFLRGKILFLKRVTNTFLVLWTSLSILFSFVTLKLGYNKLEKKEY